MDGFLAELMVALDEAEREKQELEDDVRRLERELHAAKEETEHLKQHLTETLQAPSHQELVCAELEKERDELIESIKLLRRNCCRTYSGCLPTNFYKGSDAPWETETVRAESTNF